MCVSVSVRLLVYRPTKTVKVMFGLILVIHSRLISIVVSSRVIICMCIHEYRSTKTVKVMFGLILVIHILSCLWWIYKVLFMTEEEVYASSY